MNPATLQAERLDAALCAWAARKLGFDRRALRLERLRAVAASEALGCGWPRLLEGLERGEASLDAALIAAATVGGDLLSRQREHFDLLAKMEASASGVLTAWSAGCSTGEEAYSLAAALLDALGLEPGRLRVWGTDANPSFLAVAQKAEYGRWSFRAAAQEGEGGPGSLSEAALRAKVLDPGTRSTVRFAVHNLLEEPAFDGLQGPRFHLVFCRNVLVYFQAEAAQRALGHLVGSLLPGGWLVLGNMDLATAPKGLKRVGPASLCVFEKPRAGGDEPAPRPAGSIPFFRPGPRGPGLKRAARGTSAQALPPVSRVAVQAPAPEDLVLDPVDWHRGVLAQMEQGDEDQALMELLALLEAHPQYLPAWYEHALAQRRRGFSQLAAASLHKVLDLAQGRPAGSVVEGPERLSLDFYVSGAHAFLQSLGEET